VKKIKKIFIVFLVLFSVLIILPFLISVETYLRQAETIASEKLNIPVRLGKGHVAFVPSVRLIVDDILVGQKDEIKVEQLIVIPTLASLFSERRTIDIKIINPVVKKDAITLLTSLQTNSAQDGNSPVSLRKVYIDDLVLVWPEMKLPLIDVDARFIKDNQLETASLETQDGHLRVNVQPEGDAQRFEVYAKEWVSPISLPVLIDQAKLTGTLKEGILDIADIDIALYQGKLTGNTRLTWGKNWKVNGKIDVKKVAVEKPSTLVSKSVYLSGDLYGSGKFSSVAKDVAQLPNQLQANFKFNVKDGVVHGLDLLKMASLLIRQNQKGDMTQFDTLSGLMKTSGKQYHLQNLKVASGYLAATGQVKVKTNKTLDGEVEVEMKNSASLAAIPLIVAGTVDSPLIYPSKSAIAGAVAGTAILGPGVGTTLGMKAGSALNRIKESFSSPNP
jgi:hypothetical protein